MIPFHEMDYHPTAEKLVEAMIQRTQSDNPLFFRVLVAFYFAQVASAMRCSIKSPTEPTELPVNMFAIDLAPSGFGKNRAANLMEDEVLHQFQTYYETQTFPLAAEQNLIQLGHKRAIRNGTDPDDEYAKIQTEFKNQGPMVYSFGDCTPAAVLQARQKLLMANCGALTLQVDEIAQKLGDLNESAAVFLELFDKGKVKQKLIKHTKESLRAEDIRGGTPTNMLLFGTPFGLFDGGKNEEQMFGLMETGLARRCLFGIVRKVHTQIDEEPDLLVAANTLFDRQAQHVTSTFLQDLADQFERLANLINLNKVLPVSKETCLELIQYDIMCKRKADTLPEHEVLKGLELKARSGKALKLAGAYAFIDNSSELTTTHLFNAIKLTEDSAQAFEEVLAKDPKYVKLAKYLGSVNADVTQVDLVESLPCYKGSMRERQDMLTMAITWGYQNNIIIKKSYQDGIEWLRGESLKETDLNNMIVTYSTDMTTGYNNDVAAFDQLHKMTQAPGIHWIAHHLKGGYRNDDNVIPGFNLLVVDVDGGCDLNTAKLLLRDYRALYYTTKRHTAQDQRFRIILPVNYELKLDQEDFREFYNNFLKWLPFEADTAGNQRCKKWLSHPGHFEYTDGSMVDVLPFIPKTTRNEERKKHFETQQQMDNLERWVMNNTGDGNRNQMLHRYAMILVDVGFDAPEIQAKVIDLNDKLADKLDEAEILSTVMVTVGKAIAKR